MMPITYQKAANKAKFSGCLCTACRFLNFKAKRFRQIGPNDHLKWLMKRVRLNHYFWRIESIVRVFESLALWSPENYGRLHKSNHADVNVAQ
uniref:Uncharacterized protein n=1 Tax=Parascaris univalens TaxID=6257 RepID=A0A915C8C4_PARUN